MKMERTLECHCRQRSEEKGGAKRCFYCKKNLAKNQTQMTEEEHFLGSLYLSDI